VRIDRASEARDKLYGVAYGFSRKAKVAAEMGIMPLAKALLS
jgi:hypothetical protein